MIIRKISIGNDLLNAMHFQAGKPAMGGSSNISDIIKNIDGSIDVFISRSPEGLVEIVKWKTIGATVPVTIEYNLEF
jgi:hypothetical protein